MVTLRSKPRTLETPVNPKQNTNQEQPHSTKSEDVFGYEQCREKRIKENMERMQKLGLFDLSSKLKSQTRVPKRTPRRTPQSTPLQSFLPSRRSSRLQDAPAVRYSELPEEKVGKGKRGRNLGPLVGEGVRPEVYNEEHEKLLGTCESTWTLFVDGIGADGKRIYDSVKGKTCHQCRQKTLGHRTHCSTCNLVQGQFCGDCLYMRYGEHVLEVNQNPDWVCPPCRGICNCSLCRQAKGWPATGALYRKITSLGFKSVAHYLIQTHRAETKSDDVVADDPVSAKRSLTFKVTEEVAGNESSLNSDSGQHGSPKRCTSDKKGDGSEEEKKESVNGDGVKYVVSASEAKPDSILSRLRQRGKKAQTECTDTKPLNVDDEMNKEKEEEVNELAIKTTPAKRKMKSVLVHEPNPDSISGRLRQRRNRS